MSSDAPNIVNFGLYKLMHSVSPWETKAQNEIALARLRGLPARTGTPESDSDPQNPNQN
jgi:hypothetical protein